MTNRLKLATGEGLQSKGPFQRRLSLALAVACLLSSAGTAGAEPEGKKLVEEAFADSAEASESKTEPAAEGKPPKGATEAALAKPASKTPAVKPPSDAVPPGGQDPEESGRTKAEPGRAPATPETAVTPAKSEPASAKKEPAPANTEPLPAKTDPAPAKTEPPPTKIKAPTDPVPDEEPPAYPGEATETGIQEQEGLRDADRFLLQGKFRQAEERYRELLPDDTTGDACAGLSVALAKQGTPAKILEAEKILRKAKSKFADNPNLLAAGGYVSLVHSKSVASPAKRDQYLEAAEALCRKAIETNPDILIAQQTLGMVKIDQDDYDAAIEPLRKCVKLSETATNLTLLAQVLLRIDPKDAEAAELVDKALRLDKNYQPAHLQKALVLCQESKYEDAFMELHNIPDAYRSFDWHLIEGDIYRKQGDGPAALAAWRESIRLNPHSPESYKHMAEYYAMRGDGELGIASLHDALEILPNDMALRQQLAELALRQDKLDVAEAEYRTVLAGQPDDPGALLGLSRVFFRKARKDGQYPPGWQQLMDQLQTVITEHGVRGKLIKSGTKNLQDNIELSEAERALAQNRFKEARQHFQTVINGKRDNAYDLLTLGEQAFYDGDLHSAEQAFTFAKEMSDAAPRAEQGLSKIHAQRNEASRQTKLGDATRASIPEVAVDHYKQALIADPQHADAYYGLFCLYGKSKTPEADLAVNYGNAFLELADESNPLRKEVEAILARLKSRLDKDRKKK